MSRVIKPEDVLLKHGVGYDSKSAATTHVCRHENECGYSAHAKLDGPKSRREHDAAPEVIFVVRWSPDDGLRSGVR